MAGRLVTVVAGTIAIGLTTGIASRIARELATIGACGGAAIW